MVETIHWYKHRAKKIYKNDFEEKFKLINNAVFGKTMKNVRKHRDVRLLITEARTINLVSEPNFLSEIISNRN